MAVTLLGNDKNLCILNVCLPYYNGSTECECELLECFSYIDYAIQQQREIYGNIDICICVILMWIVQSCTNTVVVLDY